MKFIFNDGGRSDYFNGDTGDCVVRSIAIVSGRDYGQVYDELFEMKKEYGKTSRSRAAKRCHLRPSPRDGVNKAVYDKYLEKYGFVGTATMGIGTGCTVHLRDGELPMGRLLVSVSSHMTAVIDGVIHDTFDPSRDGTRCVYKYWTI